MAEEKTTPVQVLIKHHNTQYTSKSKENMKNDKRCIDIKSK